jgi:hypothetical protein
MDQTAYINEELKGRMLRHVSAIWGVRNTDALDPLVRLLVEAIAGELQKTHHEIDNFEKRILEKIAILLTPGILSSPYPAHAVVHAQPIESTHTVSTKTHFFHSKKIANEKEPPHDLFFTPVVDMKLFNGYVKYIVSGSKAFVMDSPLQKSIYINGQQRTEYNNSIWVGLKLDDNIKNLEKLSFYIDFKNTGYKQQLFALFHSSQWFVDKHQLQMGKGTMYNHALKKAELFTDFDTMHLLEKEIAHLYDEQFISIEDATFQINEQTRTRHPKEFEAIFNRGDLVKFTEDLLWVRIVTPSIVEERMLIDMFVSINAFPVLNRKLNKLHYRLKSITNIIPIKSSQYDYFIAVDSLKDAFGKTYKQIPYSEDDNELTGTYSIRKSGTERIDARSSKEYLRYLIELVRDESVAFASYGQDTITSLSKELDKILAQIEQRVKQSKSLHTDSHYYVTVESSNNTEVFFMDYWTTNSIHANSIHAGVKLHLYEGTEIKAGSTVFLSTTSGGKGGLEPARHVDAYKYAVLSHNKIVTVEDIKAFFYYELGDKIDQVNVRKGLINSENPKEGLIRCVEIELIKKKSGVPDLDPAEWESLLNRLKSKMELRSSLNMNFVLKLSE